MNRRSFLNYSASAASLAFFDTDELFNIFDPSKISSTNDVSKIIGDLKNYGLERFRFMAFPDLKAMSSAPVFKINSSYGRLANFDVSKLTNITEPYIITRGPAGAKFKQQYPHLQVIGKYSAQVREYQYLTDAAPHFWNNLHRNRGGHFKTYFIDTSTRESVQLYINVYSANKREILENIKVMESIGHLHELFKTHETKAFAALQSKYEVANFGFFLGNKLNLSKG